MIVETLHVLGGWRIRTEDFFCPYKCWRTEQSALSFQTFSDFLAVGHDGGPLLLVHRVETEPGIR